MRARRVARAALVMGVSGIGKTRLVREFFSLPGNSPGNIIRCTGTWSIRSDFGCWAPCWLLWESRPATRGGRGQARLAQWLRGKCAGGAPIVALEDLQWADAASVQVMDEVLGLLSDQPLLVLALGRPEVEEHFPGLWGERMVETIRLAPLSRKAGQSLLRMQLPR